MAYNSRDSNTMVQPVAKGIGAVVVPNLSLEKTLKNSNDKVLIVIQLVGGNDGLASVFPLNSYDNLIKHRSNILIKQKLLLQVSDELALHPSLKGFKSLLDQNSLSILQNVGYRNQNRSHFRSIDIWNSGSSAIDTWNTGWLGRYLDTNHWHFSDTFSDPAAISIGNIVSDTLQGEAEQYSYALASFLNLKALDEYPSDIKYTGAIMDEIRFINDNIHFSNKFSDRIKKASQKAKNLSWYPDGNELAQQLKMVAQLIAGGLKTKIYFLTIGGFDTHAYQTTKDDPTKGNHADLLKTLSEAIYYFQTDLQKLNLEDRVMGMTYSEFGRQIKSNNSFGTDHGSAAPMFIFGNKILSSVIGKTPDILAELPNQAGVEMELDFRDVYATILNKWFGVETEIINMIFKRTWTPIPCIKD